jgi:hypothetical protein
MHIIRVVLERRGALGADGYDVVGRLSAALAAAGGPVRHVSRSRVEPGVVELAVFVSSDGDGPELVRRAVDDARPWGWVLVRGGADTPW